MTLYKHTRIIGSLDKAKSLFRQICHDIENLNIATSEYKTIPISPLTGITGMLYLMEYIEELSDKFRYSFVVDKLRRI